MKKKILFFLVFLFLLIPSCKSNKELVITFVVNGGSIDGDSTNKQVYRLNTTGDTYEFKSIVVPQKEGYLFSAWFTDSKLDKYFDMLNTPINKSLTVYADYVKDCFKFRLLEDDTVSIAITEESEDFSIPKYLIGRKVTGLMENAFATTSKKTFDFTYTDIELIQKNAFSNSKITTITIGSKVKKIEEDAFYNADELTKITVLNNNQYIATNGYLFEKLNDGTFKLFYAFAPTSTTVDGINFSNFSFTITEIGAHAFKDIKVENISLQGYKIYLPANLKSINDLAFENFHVYRNNNGEYTVMQTLVYIPKSVLTIGKYAFANSSVNIIALESNSNLKSIGDYAFYNSKLTRFFTITEFPYTFDYQSSTLTFKINVDGNSLLPGTGQIIYNGTVYDDLSNQQEVSLSIVSSATVIQYVYYVIPNVEAVRLSLALTNKNGLYSITGLSTSQYLSYLPPSLKQIGVSAFVGTSLKQLYFSSDCDIGDRAFVNIIGFKGYLPSSATTLAANFEYYNINYAFY